MDAVTAVYKVVATRTWHWAKAFIIAGCSSANTALISGHYSMCSEMTY